MRNLICKNYGRHQERGINLGSPSTEKLALTLNNLALSSLQFDFTPSQLRAICSSLVNSSQQQQPYAGAPQTAAICRAFCSTRAIKCDISEIQIQKCSCNVFPWSPCPRSPHKTLELLSYPQSFVRPDFFRALFSPSPAIFYLREDMTLILAKMISTGSKTRLGIHGTGQELA